MATTDNLTFSASLTGGGFPTQLSSNGPIAINYATNPPTVSGAVETTSTLANEFNYVISMTFNSTTNQYTLSGATPNGNATFSLVYTGQNPTSVDSATYSFTGPGASPQSPDTETLARPSNATISATPVCFASGTLIKTVRGDVAVEVLKIGDIVITVAGKHRPITWIGHRTLGDSSGAAQAFRHLSTPRFRVIAEPEPRTDSDQLPFNSWPVRILAGAFGGDLPERDLWLSPGHPVLVGVGSNEHLVPIMCLINGTTIERVPVASVTYWHIELDEHDILLAEGLGAESFLDFGNRPWFGPRAEAHALANPDVVVPGLDARCRPVAIDGPVVEAERRRLDVVFATSLETPCAWPNGDEMRWDC